MKMDVKNLRERQANLIENKFHHKKIVAIDAVTKVVIVKEDDEISTIIKKLKKEDTNHVIVVDDDENFLGDISVEKLIKIMAHTSIDEPLVKILDVGYHRGINYTTAKDHLEKHSNLVKFNTPILEVLKLIDKEGFSYIPVLDEENKIKGLITPSSLLDLLSKH